MALAGPPTSWPVGAGCGLSRLPLDRPVPATVLARRGAISFGSGDVYCSHNRSKHRLSEVSTAIILFCVPTFVCTRACAYVWGGREVAATLVTREVSLEQLSLFNLCPVRLYLCVCGLCECVCVFKVRHGIDFCMPSSGQLCTVPQCAAMERIDILGETALFGAGHL